MKYLIVYSSRTGNTRQLAEEIREMLPEEDCLYYGQPGDEAVEKGGTCRSCFCRILGRPGQL